MWLLILQRIAIDSLVHLLLFPIWWLTGNVWRTFQFVADMIRAGNDELAPWLWLKNMFVPMFGQTDLQGRIVSMFMRLVNVVFRSIFLLFWTIVSLIMGFCWVITPVILFFFVIWQFPTI